jgi:hypothetical protein
MMCCVMHRVMVVMMVMHRLVMDRMMIGSHRKTGHSYKYRYSQ